MRCVLQRVAHAEVRVGGEIAGSIPRGLLILLGVGKGDDEERMLRLASKIAKLRVFADEAGKMNLDVRQVGGSALVVSQFTLYGDVANGNRPSFSAAAAPDAARSLYGRFCDALREQGLPVATGIFAADMQVTLLNDGPVTLVLDDQAIGA